MSKKCGTRKIFWNFRDTNITYLQTRENNLGTKGFCGKRGYKKEFLIKTSQLPPNQTVHNRILRELLDQNYANDSLILLRLFHLFEF